MAAIGPPPRKSANIRFGRPDTADRFNNMGALSVFAAPDAARTAHARKPIKAVLG